MANYNAQYRDTVFRSFFNDQTRLLSLCNAVLETDYTNPDELNINTLEGIFFDKQKNDISCTIHNHFLVLVEHQTSVNENMPFRCLSYVAELLNNLVKDKHKRYYKGLIKFPRPKFFVFYDGDKHEPLQRQMRLSDAFDGDSDSLELIVTAFNINDAISRAVKFCLDNSIMGDYLVKHAEEVFNMLALEWNLDDALQARFEEGYEDGREEEREAIALNMIRSGMLAENIHEFTRLSLERIRELEKNIHP
ncbi:MAG: Rpn family recombination-promoting nuclease/putative transposase [Selenomonadaceae bacterium]|nr:Rpn family recombination-promoting nuclease/putative transposase [Selenomonadaceae bacterium]